MLGLDPLYVANEGKMVAIVAPEAAEASWRRCGVIPGARRRSSDGHDTNPGLVTMRTTLGTTRIVDMLAGDQLPRICWKVTYLCMHALLII